MSVVALKRKARKRIPAGAFRTKRAECVQYLDQLVLREMDKVCLRLAQFLEAEGAYAFPLASQETKWELKRASYGYLSGRHLAIEAGLGTMGLEVNFLSPEFGPRCYTSAVLTTAPVSIYNQVQAGSLALAAAYSVVLMTVSLVVYPALRRQMERHAAPVAMEG